jgi:hypothetical protein
MKTSKTLRHADKSRVDEISKKEKAIKVSRYILLIFILSFTFLFTSCIAFVPVEHGGRDGGGGHGGGHREHNDRQGRH